MNNVSECGIMAPKPKILVVDDDRSICRLVDSILEMEGYPRCVVTSGEQARKAIVGEIGRASCRERV